MNDSKALSTALIAEKQEERLVPCAECKEAAQSTQPKHEGEGS